MALNVVQFAEGPIAEQSKGVCAGLDDAVGVGVGVGLGATVGVGVGVSVGVLGELVTVAPGESTDWEVVGVNVETGCGVDAVGLTWTVAVGVALDCPFDAA